MEKMTLDVGNKELEKYDEDRIKYKLHNTKKIISESTYCNLEDNANKIMDVQFGLKVQDRYKPDWELTKAEYKNKVRRYISDKLEDEIKLTRDPLKMAVAKEINIGLYKKIIETMNRVVVKLLDEDISEYVYPSGNEFVCVDVHGFSHNYMYEQSGFRNTRRTDSYNRWICNFPNQQVPDMDYWEVDWSKPIEMFIHYSAKEEMDVRNLDKATIDMIVGRIYGVDDNIVDSISSKRVATVDNYADGKISFFIRNI